MYLLLQFCSPYVSKDRFLVNTFHFSAKEHFNTFFTHDCLCIVKYPHPLTINKKHFREFLKIVPYQHLTWGGRNGCLKDDDSRNGGNLEICDFCSICYCCCCSSLCRIAHWAIRKIDQVARALKLNLNDRLEKLRKHQQSIEDWKIPKHFHCVVTSLQSALPFWAARWKENLASSLKSSSSSPTLTKSHTR